MTVRVENVKPVYPDWKNGPVRITFASQDPLDRLFPEEHESMDKAIENKGKARIWWLGCPVVPLVICGGLSALAEIKQPNNEITSLITIIAIGTIMASFLWSYGEISKNSQRRQALKSYLEAKSQGVDITKNHPN